MSHLSIAAVALLLSQADVTRDGDWMRITTAHFALSVQTADEALTKKYSARLEEIYEAYSKELSAAAAKPLPVKLFKTLQEYQAYVRNPNSGGVYDEKKKELATFHDGNTRLDTTLQHEVVHCFEDRMFPAYATSGIATWLSEGMAMYYENHAKDEKGNLKIAIDKRRCGVIKDLVKEGKHVSFKLFFLWPREQFMAPGVGEQRYAQAWAVFHFLKQTPNEKYKAILPAYLKLLQEGKSWFAAHQAAFKGVNPDQLETDWKDFVSKLEPTK